MLRLNNKLKFAAPLILLRSTYKNKIRQSFLFPFVLDYFGLTIPENSEPIIQYVFGVTILSLIALISFINVFAYLFIMYSMINYNLEKKYPRFKRIINYYKKSSLIIIIIEFTLGLSCLLMLFILSLIGLKNMFFT